MSRFDVAAGFMLIIGGAVWLTVGPDPTVITVGALLMSLGALLMGVGMSEW